MKRVERNFLGGIFKWPSLKELKDKIRGKFGYLPRDEQIENHEYYPLNVSPCILPRIYSAIFRF
jgi:hypothetical protein